MSRRLVVVSDQALVAEAVRAAMRAHGFDTVVLPWSAGGSADQSILDGPGASGLLISDLSTMPSVRTGQEIVRGTPLPWLLLTGAPRGAIWGALLEAGVVAVLPTSVTIRETRVAIDRIAEGQELMTAWEREELIEQWREERTAREQFAERLESLTQRERTVLQLLFSGHHVAEIAGILEISESTVRTHVRAVLRKLGVRSQIGAVAAYGWLRQR